MDPKVLYVEGDDRDVLCCMAYYAPVECDYNKDRSYDPCERGGFAAEAP